MSVHYTPFSLKGAQGYKIRLKFSLDLGKINPSFNYCPCPLKCGFPNVGGIQAAHSPMLEALQKPSSGHTLVCSTTKMRLPNYKLAS